MMKKWLKNTFYIVERNLQPKTKLPYFVIAGIGNNFDDTFTAQHSEFIKTHAATLIVVNAEGALYVHLPGPTQDLYQQKYMHWAGNPAKLVDMHANNYAHGMIADELFKYIH